ncbi:MAG TPA: hypothetical protein VK149_00235 [Sideroxyarcus sp.]|nr:hypothetical protein [Sideroxyarcus sp.]
MANHVGVKLCRLIRERAYLSGSLPDLQKQIIEIKAQLVQARKKLRQAHEQLHLLDKGIASLSAMDTADIRPIRATPRKLVASHGAFTQELIKILSEGLLPVKTEAIIRHMAEVFDMPRSTPAERENTRRRITRRLRMLVEKNAVERLHDPSCNQGGLWRWIGSYGEDA